MKIDGEQVSSEWYVALSVARREGVRFYVTDGRRTIAEQWARYRHYCRYGRPIAAFPSPNAPHIRSGRIDHALDVNALDGGQRRLAAWLRRNGIRAAFTVPSEAWHMEAPAADLRRFAARHQVSPKERARRSYARRLRMAYAKRRRAKGEGINMLNRRIQTLKKRLKALR